MKQEDKLKVIQNGENQSNMEKLEELTQVLGTSGEANDILLYIYTKMKEEKKKIQKMKDEKKKCERYNKLFNELSNIIKGEGFVTNGKGNKQH